MGIVFCQNSFIGELFWHSRIYGYDFQKFSRFMGILLRNFSGSMGGTFTISMAQPRILETQVTPPPPRVLISCLNSNEGVGIEEQFVLISIH